MFFQLLRGIHQGNGPEPQTYKAGDIVTSDTDLVKTFGASRFRLLTDEEAAQLQAEQRTERERVAEQTRQLIEEEEDEKVPAETSAKKVKRKLRRVR